MQWLGLDIGGANLKAADGRGFALSRPFALWRQPNELTDALRRVIADSPPASHLAATMTGELADYFETKADGVRFIVEALHQAADGRQTRIYRTDGTLVSPQAALREPLLAAAANWHALARFAGRYAGDGSALLIDIGSTTCDVIPLFNGKPMSRGCTDTERLLHGELVYTGIERTPICAVCATLPYRGRECPTAAEWFATTGDAYLILGELPEKPDHRDTADGRPATVAAARDRLARCICADRDSFNMSDARTAVEAIAATQVAKIVASLQQVIAALPESPKTTIVSGRGEFLARRAISAIGLESTIVSLQHECGRVVSECGPAHALAVLAREACWP
jgi:probable H4MPT-linked C1 transfer pathway protein